MIIIVHQRSLQLYFSATSRFSALAIISTFFKVEMDINKHDLYNYNGLLAHKFYKCINSKETSSQIKGLLSDKVIVYEEWPDACLEQPCSNRFSNGGWKVSVNPMALLCMWNWILTFFPPLNSSIQFLKLGYHQSEPDLSKVGARNNLQFLGLRHTFVYLNMLDSAFLIPVNLGCIRIFFCSNCYLTPFFPSQSLFPGRILLVQIYRFIQSLTDKNRDTFVKSWNKNCNSLEFSFRSLIHVTQLREHWQKNHQ